MLQVKHHVIARTTSWGFCGICGRQCHYEFNTVFWKSCIVFCAKLKEVDPITLISLRQINVFDSIQPYNQQQRIKINRIWGHQWLQCLLFLLKIYITAVSYIWSNDTQLFVTWRVHPENSSSLRLLVLCLVCPDLFVIYYCCLFFQGTNFFGWLPWQMPHQCFQRFDSYRFHFVWHFLDVLL